KKLLDVYKKSSNDLKIIRQPKYKIAFKNLLKLYLSLNDNNKSYHLFQALILKFSNKREYVYFNLNKIFNLCIAEKSNPKLKPKENIIKLEYCLKKIQVRIEFTLGVKSSSNNSMLSNYIY